MRLRDTWLTGLYASVAFGVASLIAAVAAYIFSTLLPWVANSLGADIPPPIRKGLWVVALLALLPIFVGDVVPTVSNVYAKIRSRRGDS